jgi:hypothetical protein
MPKASFKTADRDKAHNKGASQTSMPFHSPVYTIAESVNRLFLTTDFILVRPVAFKEPSKNDSATIHLINVPRSRIKELFLPGEKSHAFERIVGRGKNQSHSSWKYLTGLYMLPISHKGRGQAMAAEFNVNIANRIWRPRSAERLMNY